MVRAMNLPNRFFVRLYNPRNGLVLASPNLVVIDIADKPDEPVVVNPSSMGSSSQGTSINSSSSAAVIEPKKSGSGGALCWILICMLAMLIIDKRIIFRGNESWQ